MVIPGTGEVTPMLMTPEGSFRRSSDCAATQTGMGEISAIPRHMRVGVSSGQQTRHPQSRMTQALELARMARHIQEQVDIAAEQQAVVMLNHMKNKEEEEDDIAAFDFAEGTWCIDPGVLDTR